MKKQLWDPVRSVWLVATPEEEVRQSLIEKMIQELHFPKGLLAVEKDLASLLSRPLKKGLDPHRRVDLLAYAKSKERLLPLLLVECKADPEDRRALHQALGYNEAIGAPFLCIARGEIIKTFWKEKGGIASLPFLPDYLELVEKLCLFQRL